MSIFSHDGECVFVQKGICTVSNCKVMCTKFVSIKTERGKDIESSFDKDMQVVSAVIKQRYRDKYNV